ncbi:MAG: tRNA pseudouridine(38-40) synthase TruA [Actinomycetota bacterium]|nr:tRNA pseudouridine(38-40) synthase TruA [Actinomycetota bacterium]
MTLFDAEDAGDPPSSVAEDDPAPARPSALVRLRMTVAYDGSGFRGFAHNPGVVTVGGTLREALAKVLGQTVDLTCAGRTDAGVHAWGQVVHFDVGEGAAAAEGVMELQRSLNRMLAPRIVVRELDVAAPGFDARRSATGRRYRYTVLNQPLPDPFLAATAWHVAEPLDVRAMQLACDPLIGEHDWSSFCRKPVPSPRAGPQPHPPRRSGDPSPAGAVLSPRVGPQPHPPRRSGDPSPAGAVPEASLVRIVRFARWLELGDGVLRFDIEASAFCHQMVRSLVGTLVAVGRGRLRAGDLAWIIRSRDRSLAAQPAPPHGLCLWEALYEPESR